MSQFSRISRRVETPTSSTIQPFDIILTRISRRVETKKPWFKTSVIRYLESQEGLKQGGNATGGCTKILLN